jgi:hypothetical protein
VAAFGLEAGEPNSNKSSAAAVAAPEDGAPLGAGDGPKSSIGIFSPF